MDGRLALPPSFEPRAEAGDEPATGATEVAGDIALPAATTGRGGAPGGRILRREEWKRLERQNLLAALAEADWQIAGPGGAARLLDMKPSTLRSRIKALAIEKPD